ncbi:MULTISPECIES: SF1B family DNA helicase RecD2 [Sporosarcina]|uniref:SF1B family DNA helicase RecD2 n=1 Tax=Sporosarcina TaxID=1569 RepID=UPI00129B2637|nr:MULTISPECIES: ATP-dependent RecD-like DNA helicase [Sporosarcina]GKV66766.1 ATP-dependent RecD-like DNA helicase [Sporosarcina sp. NCCP-2331]GLB57051.1 ATP-dependent RecD-like DNA helicase [Sporosarcina sp. NCCP-2378]
MTNEEEQYLIGRPVVTIFHNSTNLFSIVKMKVTSTNTDYRDKEIVIKGSFPPLIPEEDYKFTGRLVNHPVHGQQFDVQTFAKELPATEAGLVHYLSGDLFPGIGKKTASDIVKTLGNNVIQKILEDRSVLDQIPRLSDERKDTLVAVLQENLGLERTMVQLNEWGFGPQVAMRIYQLYQDDAIEILSENPYRLIKEIEGIGFQRADDLAQQLGLVGDHPARIKAAVYYSVHNEVQSAGHVYVEAETILPQAKQLLETSQPYQISYDSLSQAVIELVEEGTLSAEKQRLYLPSLYFSELGIAAKVHRILENEVDEQFPASEIRKAIGEIEERLGVQYAETQVEAIEKALHSSLLVLTGGPGTGKTTVIRGLVEAYAELHGLSLDLEEYVRKKEPFPIILAAPTGRAAKRMSEATGLPAMTIHRLLGFTGQESEEETEREVDGNLIIIDETSMVDTWLMHQLLKAVRDDAQLLFVGDQDQLPSVGPGQVLHDFMQSGEIPVVELTDIFRQSEGSTIIEMAHMIKQKKWSMDVSKKTSDRSFIRASSEQILPAVKQIIQSALSKGHSIKDIQVLAPMYKGPAGIDGLNKMIQEITNPPAHGRKEMTFGETTYRVGDKVLQLVNQPESNVFNGDMGEVVAIMLAKETTDKKAILVVSYDGNEVTYERGDLNQITLAYCCSIHKSQGSEFPIVVMPIVRSQRKMLRRNLLYTGITRAKNFLILCGEAEEFKAGIERTDETERQTTLKERISGMIEEMEEPAPAVREETAAEQPAELFVEAGPAKLTMDNFRTVDPMIGMSDVTPLQFL